MMEVLANLKVLSYTLIGTLTSHLLKSDWQLEFKKTDVTT